MNKVIGALLVSVASSAVFADALPENVVYRNDFTTRESEQTIPELGVWHDAQPYPSTTGEILDYVNPSLEVNGRHQAYGRELYGNLRYVYFHDYFTGDLASTGHSTNDGWFYPNWKTGTASGYGYLWSHRFGINASDSENPCAWFYYTTSTMRNGLVLQSLHNNFTNGQLKIQVDMRTPLRWQCNGKSRHFMIYPVYEKYMHNEAWDGESCTGLVSPGKFGFRAADGEANNMKTGVIYYDARKEKKKTQLFANYKSSTYYYWFRYEVIYDLDKAMFSGTAKSLDKEGISYTNVDDFAALPRPTFETTPTATLEGTFNDALWIGCETNAAGRLITDMSAFWAEKRGISGLGVFAGELGGDGTLNLYGTSSANTNNVFVDNIRVSWKAPGSDEFAVCYENDFKLRRYRTLSSSAATKATYAAKTEAKTEKDAFAGYPDGKPDTSNILPEVSSAATLVGEAGVDGWRRHYWCDDKSIDGPVSVQSNDTYIAGGAGGKVMVFGGNGSYTCMSQPIGTSLTDGKVMLQADVFLQGEWSGFKYKEDCDRAMLVLGETTMHTAPTAAFSSGAAASFGYRKTRSGTSPDYSFEWEAIKGPYGAASVFAGACAPEKNNWYRYRIVADLDAKTYDVTVWPMGGDSIAPGTVPTADPILEQTGIAFENSVAEVGSFAIYGFGYTANALNHRVMVDNILVAHNGETLYENNFDERTRTVGGVQKSVGYLAYEYNNDDGPDGWIRQDGLGEVAGWASATVRNDNGNQFASLGAEREVGDNTCYGHAFGTCLTNDSFKFSVDIRPPSSFKAKGGLASVTLGGRSLEQLQNHRGCDADKMLEFGFKGTNTAYAAGVGEKGLPFVGDQLLTFKKAVDHSHWYRFVVRSALAKDVYSIRVYDMGAEHPTEISSGELVSAARGLVPNTAFSTGLSAFYLTAKQVGNTSGETGADPCQMLVDNIKLERAGDGLVLVFR